MKSPKKHTRPPKKIKSRKLPKNEFPTLKQLLAYYYYQKETKNFQGDVFLVMATDLVSIWKKVLIPTITVRSVRNKLHRILMPIITEFTKNKKYPNSSELAKCFNIAKCSCFNNVTSLDYLISITNRPNCVCLDVDKIPEGQIEFFANQMFKDKIPKIDHKFINSRIDADAIEKHDLLARKVQNKGIREAQGKLKIERHRQLLAEDQFVTFSQSSTSSNSQNLVESAARDAN